LPGFRVLLGLTAWERCKNLLIEQGMCYALFAYDVSLAIDLEDAERRMHAITERGILRHRRPTPRYFEYRPAPIRVSQAVEPLTIVAWATTSTVDVVLHDFGALLVMYRIPLHGAFTDLLALSDTLYDNATLLTDSRQRVEQLCSVIQSTTTRLEIADVVEDYVIFHIQAFSEPVAVATLRGLHGEDIARILRAEPQPLSELEVEDALLCQVSYVRDDFTVIDWNAALVYDHEGDDIRAVLEFANVELLEMRYLDQLLDEALDQSYRTLPTRPWWAFAGMRRYRNELRRLAQLQVDSALLFEGVNNALKLVGDQYLARGYRLASQRFHLSEWDASILRKLHTLESIYEKVSDQATGYRAEMPEWIIILLITFEIVWPFLTKCAPVVG
jgi:hypothetical protein